jgi:ribosomal protein L11 methyltransferase
MDEKNIRSADKTWYKVAMSVDKADADKVRRAIESPHCCGVQSEDEAANREHLDAYFDDAIDTSELQRHMEIIADLVSAASGRTLKLGAIEAVPEQDWEEEWRRTWKPVRVSESLVICPSWEHYAKKPGETVVRIYPHMAFGTGSHPTTRLCLRLLEQFITPNARVIDIGAGSGILAIAAVKLGAGRVTAVEMDEAAITNAIENCTFNRVRSKIKLVHDGFGAHIRGRFDLGVCNMLGHVMRPLLGDMTRLLTGRKLILSGLSAESAREIQDDLGRHGWNAGNTLSEDEWVGFVATQQAG